MATKLLYHFNGNLVDASASALSFPPDSSLTYPSGKFGVGVSNFSLISGGIASQTLSESNMASLFNGTDPGGFAAWTIECQLKLVSGSAEQTIFQITRGSGNRAMWAKLIDNSYIEFGFYNNTYGSVSVAGLIGDGLFHHFAIVFRNSYNYIDISIDGVVGSHIRYDYSLNGSEGAGGFPLNLSIGGGYAVYGLTLGSFVGVIDEFRLSDGAIYSGNFTPPTQAFTISGQSGGNMAQQLKKKYLGPDSVDSTKIKLLKDQVLRGTNQAGNEVELLKLNTSDKLLVMGSEVATKAMVDQEVIDRNAAIATSLSTAEGYTNTAINNLVAGASQALDTLKELADALGNDANFASTVLGQIGGLDTRLITAEGHITTMLSDISSIQGDITSLQNTHEVKEYANFASFPATGEVAIIYVDLALNELYRWNGAAYVQVGGSGSLAGDVSLLTGRVSVLEGDVGTLQSEMISAQGAISTAQSDISNLQSHDLTIDGEITAIQGDISTLQGDMSSAQGNISMLQGDMITAQDAILSNASAISNHISNSTGAHAASAISFGGVSDVDTALSGVIFTVANDVIHKDGSIAMAANLDLGTHKLVNVVDPTAFQDAATKAYVDANGGAQAIALANGTVAMTAGKALLSDSGSNTASKITLPAISTLQVGSIFVIANPTATSLVSGGGIYQSNGTTLITTFPAGHKGNFVLINKSPETWSANFEVLRGASGYNFVSRALLNVTDPTNAQDAATKNYVDTTKATRALDNLASVAINTALLPATSGSTDVGSVLKPFGHVHANTVHGKTFDVKDDAGTSSGYLTASSAGNNVVLAADSTRVLDINTTDGEMYIMSESPSAAKAISILSNNNAGAPLASGRDSGAIQLKTQATQGAGVSGNVIIGAGINSGDASKSGQVSISGKALDVNTTYGMNMNSKIIFNVSDPANAQDAATKNYVVNQDALKVSKSGDSMTGNLAMGGNMVSGLGTTTNATDAATKAYVDAYVTSGVVWLHPIIDADLIDDSLTVQPVSPAVGDTYIAAATAGNWVAGHAYTFYGGVWVDLLGRAVAIGDRFGVTMEYGGTPAGGLTGKSKQIAEILTLSGVLPASYTFTVPTNNNAIYVSNDLSTHFGHSYSYNGSVWIEIGGPGAIGAGVGLVWDANVLNINLGAGIAQLPSDEVGIDIKSDGGLDLVDPSTGLHSVATDAKIAIKLDGSTLSKSSSGLKVAALGITNSEISASAAVLFSKMEELTHSKVLVSSATGILEASSISSDEVALLSGLTQNVQVELDKAFMKDGSRPMMGDIDMNNWSLSHVFNISDTGAVASIGVDDHVLYDFSNLISVDYDGRVLRSIDGGTAMLDWTTNGSLDVKTNKIVNVSEPAALSDAATKNYVDQSIGAIPAVDFTPYLQKDGSVAVEGALVPKTSTVVNIGAEFNNFHNIYTQAVMFSSNQSNSFTTSLSQGVLQAENAFEIRTANNPSSAALSLKTGNADPNTNSGAINISTGTVSGSGVKGKVVISASSMDMSSSKIINLADPTSNQDASTKKYVDDVAAPLLARVFVKESITLVAGDITNGYVDLANEAVANSVVAFVGRLGMHQGYDFTVSIVSGKTRITFKNGSSLIGDGVEAPEATDIFFFTYYK